MSLNPREVATAADGRSRSDAGAIAARRSVDIIVPVYNEEAYIDELFARVRGLGYGDCLIFVDNGSTDGTIERIRQYPEARLVCHAQNEGYGASIRHGIEVSDADTVVIMDGDLEYQPEAIPILLEALTHHPVVFCSRWLKPTARPRSLRVRRFGNRVMTSLFNVLYGQQVTDLYTGMKGFRRDAVPLQLLRRNGFEHAVEFAALSALSGHRIHEIPVDYRPRQIGTSKMRHVPETLKLGFYLLAFRFPRRS